VVEWAELGRVGLRLVLLLLSIVYGFRGFGFMCGVSSGSEVGVYLLSEFG